MSRINFLIIFYFCLLLISCVSVRKYRTLEVKNKSLWQELIAANKKTATYNYYITDTSQGFYKIFDSLRLSLQDLQNQNTKFLYRGSEPRYYGAWSDGVNAMSKPKPYLYGLESMQKFELATEFDNLNRYQMISQYLPARYLFPIPPPKPSDQILITDSLFSGKSATIIDKLSTVLNGANMGHNYYDLEDNVTGFAITTYLQEYDENTGVTKREIVSKKRSGLWDFVRTYLTDLWLEKKGYYRMFVFVMTDTAISTDGPSINYNNATDLKVHGTLVPSPEMQSLSNTKKLYCYCLLYDFIKTENNKNPDCNPNSKFSIEQHLTASNFYKSLKQYHATNH